MTTGLHSDRGIGVAAQTPLDCRITPCIVLANRTRLKKCRLTSVVAGIISGGEKLYRFDQMRQQLENRSAVTPMQTRFR